MSDPSGWKDSQRQSAHRGENRMTSTKQRLDSFSSEEEKILADVEPVVQSVRRILRQSRYSDGDRLSPDDQSYILDNVFRYHPDRSSKVAGEVDYVTVGKPESFPETRCFFVVSSDGSSADFSYLKCMENFVRKTYPEIAEPFCGKYFWRRLASDSRNGSGGDPL
ncbi:unnamed protein product [Spirodela intermedia]|uniref:Uncharacterized protein n=1 Tax=Spirodela intermedia TaxID=51605 RepID=A0A7I8KB57_SPIIN|nr:unnamed protein product [Spirodela intermedia]